MTTENLCEKQVNGIQKNVINIMTKQEIDANKNEDVLKLMIAEVKRRLNKVHLGGGKAKIEKQHSRGKLTAR